PMSKRRRRPSLCVRLGNSCPSHKRTTKSHHTESACREDCETPCPDTQSKHGQDRAEACQQCCATRPSYARRLASNCPQPMRRRFAFFPQGSACSCIEHA